MKLHITVHKLLEIKVSGRLEVKSTAHHPVTPAAGGVMITLPLSLQSAKKETEKNHCNIFYLILYSY